MPETDPREESVLVLAPTGRDARLIAGALGRHGVAALVCDSLGRVCAEISAGAAAALVAEEALPPGGLGPLVEALRRQPPWSDLPLLILTGKGAPSIGSVRRFEELEPVANVTQLERPVRTRTLVSAVRSALRARRRQYDVRSHLAERERLHREEDAERARLAEVFARAPSFLAVLRGPDHVFERVNDRYMELVGRGRKVLGRPAREALPEVEGQGYFETLDRVFRTGEPFTESAARITLDRGAGPEERVLEFVYQPLRDGAGRVNGILANGVDLTDRERAQEALRRSEERHRLLVTASADVVYRLTADWGELSPLDGKGLVPSSARPVRGWLEKNVAACDLGRVREAVRVAIRDKAVFELEHQVNRPDGTLGWTSSRAVPLFDAGGEIVEWFGTARDITDRKRAEEELQVSEGRYRALFTSMDEGYCVIEVLFDPAAPGRAVDYRFVEVNPAFEAQAGMTDVVGRRMLEFVPSIEAHWLANYGRVALTGEPIRFANEYKTLNRWFDVYAFRVGRRGEHRVAVLFTDITARRRSEGERERLVEQLRDADRKKDDFIALLAHELRNPLAPIRNGLQVIRLSEDRGTRDRSQRMMDRQLTHMVRMIDDLLDVSRIGRNKMELRKARVALAEVVASAVETARPAVEEAGHELSVELPPEPVHLDADLTRLSQVFSNLLTNSAKYTERGGRIWLGAGARGGSVAVTVRDTGIGIPAEALPRIFDMFSQVDRSNERSTGGLGIGLALVKGLVEMHGGTVTAHSEGQGRGSTFTVTLPTLAAAGPLTTPQDAGAAQPGRHKVLVVDDNRDGAESMAEMLRLLGHEVATAHDGVEALEAAGAYRPDLILMDVGMPRLNGLDATRRIREQSWGARVRVVALTGWGQENDREKSRAAGCDAHLVKPVSLQDLERMLGELHEPQ